MSARQWGAGPALVADIISGLQARCAITLAMLDWGREHPVYTGMLGQLGDPNLEPISRLRMPRKHDEPYEIAIDASVGLALAAGEQEHRKDFARSLAIGMIIITADELDTNRYFDRAPALEFVRHLRNAVCHGNRFYFKPGMPNPRFPARFRQFTITENLQGQIALYDYMTLGDVFALLDAVQMHLRAL